MAVRNVNWAEFECKNQNKTEAFEKMCTHIFCRTYQKTSMDISQSFNQPGIEIFPILVDGKKIGFQCKYCEDSSSLYQQASESIEKALNLYPDLKEIIIYTQLKIKKEGLRKDSKYKKIIKYGDVHECKITFFSNFQFDNALSEYPDIYDFYFSGEKISKLFYDSVSIDDRILLDSNEYLDIKIDDIELSKQLEEYFNNGIYVLEGKAGVGKTVALKRIYLMYEEKYKNSFDENKDCVKPIFIKLREVNSNSLMEYINYLKTFYKLKDDSSKYAYFFDGLDEVAYECFGSFIAAFESLSKSNDTFSMIFTTRLDSSNYYFFLNEFPKIRKCCVKNLSLDEKIVYVKKMNPINSNIFSIVKDNPYLYNDIFSLSVLCKNANEIKDGMTIVEIIRINLKYVENKNFKLINSLEIPNEKIDKLSAICAKVAYYMAINKCLSINLISLQSLIVKEFNNIGYNDLNKIIELLAMLYLDCSKSDKSLETLFIFKHKRYYEYYLYEYLKNVVYSDPFVLRDLNILSNRDFFLSIFMTQELKESNQKKDYVKCSILNAILSRLNYNYCEMYFNDYIKKEKVCTFNDNYFYDDKFVDYICLLSKNELDNLFSNDELIFHAFLNTKNNSLLLYQYYMRNKRDIMYLYDGQVTDFNSREEEFVYYYLYEIEKEFTYEKIAMLLFKFLDRVESILSTKYFDSLKNTALYNSKIIINHLLMYHIDFLEKIICDDEMNDERLDKICFCLLDDRNSWAFVNKDSSLMKVLRSKVDNEIADKYIAIFAVRYIFTHVKSTNEVFNNFYHKFNINNYMDWENVESLLSILHNALNHDLKFINQNFILMADIKEIVFFEFEQNTALIDRLINRLNEYSFDWKRYLSNYLAVFLATVLTMNKFEVFGVKKIIDESPDIKINKLLFIYTIFKNDINYFKMLLDTRTLNLLCPDSEVIVDYYSFSQRKMMYTNMIYLFDKEEAIVQLFECINYSILRPFDSKEQLVSIFEPTAIYMSHKYKALSDVEETNLLEMNLKQYDVISDTLYRSTYPDYLNYLLDCVEHDFDYSFRYDDGKTEPMNFGYDTSKKEFDSDFVQNSTDDSYRVDSFVFWCNCMNYLKQNDNENWAYNYLNVNYYPSMHWTKISTYSYLIVGAMFKNRFNSGILFEYLMDKMSMDGYFQLIKAFFVSGEISLAVKMIKQIFGFTNLMVFYDRKHYNDTKYIVKLNKKIVNTIYNSSSDDYIYVDNESTLLYVKDPDIFIRLPNCLDENYCEDFPCKEATFFGHIPKKELYEIFYKNHLIDYFYLLRVDGSRAIIPLIDDLTGDYDKRDINLAKLFCKQDTIEEYLNNIKYNFNKNKK